MKETDAFKVTDAVIAVAEIAAVEKSKSGKGTLIILMSGRRIFTTDSYESVSKKLLNPK